MTRYLKTAFAAAAALLAASCISNDIPYPVVELRIANVEGEGFSVSENNVTSRVVTLTLDEATDIRNVKIDAVTYDAVIHSIELNKAELLDQVRSSQELTGTFNLLSPIYTTLSLYQDYDWTIRAVQTIERRFSVTGQIGATEIEEKNRLMDAMLRLVEPQLLQINRLLEDGTAQSLKHVCLLGAYVKRRVNLALICEKKEIVPAEELTHCIRESLTYLTQYGVACALHQEGSGSVGSRDAQTAYDFFEDCLEAALPSLSAMMVRVECGARFSVRLMLEDAAGLPDGSAYARQGRLTIDDADGAPCATLSFDRGGDGG